MRLYRLRNLTTNKPSKQLTKKIKHLLFRKTPLMQSVTLFANSLTGDEGRALTIKEQFALGGLLFAAAPFTKKRDFRFADTITQAMWDRSYDNSKSIFVALQKLEASGLLEPYRWQDQYMALLKAKKEDQIVFTANLLAWLPQNFHTNEILTFIQKFPDVDALKFWLDHYLVKNNILDDSTITIFNDADSDRIAIIETLVKLKQKDIFIPELTELVKKIGKLPVIYVMQCLLDELIKIAEQLRENKALTIDAIKILGNNPISILEHKKVALLTLLEANMYEQPYINALSGTSATGRWHPHMIAQILVLLKEANALDDSIIDMINTLPQPENKLSALIKLHYANTFIPGVNMLSRENIQMVFSTHGKELENRLAALLDIEPNTPTSSQIEFTILASEALHTHGLIAHMTPRHAFMTPRNKLALEATAMKVNKI